MSNLKFTLFVSDSVDSVTGFPVYARVFSHETLEAVDRSISRGVFGHYGKKRYYLVPLEDFQMSLITGRTVVLRADYQLYPWGGNVVNPLVLGIYGRNLSTKRK